MFHFNFEKTIATAEEKIIIIIFGGLNNKLENTFNRECWTMMKRRMERDEDSYMKIFLLIFSQQQRLLVFLKIVFYGFQLELMKPSVIQSLAQQSPI